MLCPMHAARRDKISRPPGKARGLMRSTQLEDHRGCKRNDLAGIVHQKLFGPPFTEFIPKAHCLRHTRVRTLSTDPSSKAAATTTTTTKQSFSRSVHLSNSLASLLNPRYTGQPATCSLPTSRPPDRPPTYTSSFTTPGKHTNSPLSPGREEPKDRKNPTCRSTP